MRPDLVALPAGLHVNEDFHRFSCVEAGLQVALKRLVVGAVEGMLRQIVASARLRDAAPALVMLLLERFADIDAWGKL